MFNPAIRNEKLLRLLSVAGCSVLLPVFTAWLVPFLYHSGDDVFILYQLSGQMGMPPQSWTEYEWGMHTWLSSTLAAGYKIYPQLNWYAWFLILMQGISATLINIYIARRVGFRLGLVLQLLVFAGFFLPGWVHLNFSQVSLQSGIAAGTCLIPPKNQPKKWIWWPVLLLLLSASVRFHTTFLGLGLTGLSLLFFPARKWPPFILFSLLALVLSLGMYRIHAIHNEKAVPGWKVHIEKLNAFNNWYNRPVVSIAKSTMNDTLKTTAYRYQYQFFMDTNTYRRVVLERIINLLRAEKKWNDWESADRFYWTLQNHKWTLLSLAIIAFSGIFFLPGQNKWITILGPVLMIFFLSGMFLFFKLTNVMITCTALAGALVAVAGEPLYQFRFKYFVLCSLFLASVLLLYVRIPLFKTQNEALYQRFLSGYRSIPKDRLLIATTNELPLDYMALADNPAHFPLPHLLVPSQSPLALRKKYEAENTLGQRVLDTGTLYTGMDLRINDYIRSKTGKKATKKWLTDSAALVPIWKWEFANRALRTRSGK